MINRTIIGIVGATASGKTKFAVDLAAKIDAEIISVDSRQVYKELNLGVGKDLQEYNIDGKQIPYHLIDIVSLNEQYHIDRFKNEFELAYNDIISRGKRVIACGGSAFYFDVLLNNKVFTGIAIDERLRDLLKDKSLDELQYEFLLRNNNKPHQFDLSTRKRCIRAIEIISSSQYEQMKKLEAKKYDFELYGLVFDKQKLNQRIDERLEKRLEMGMVQEVKDLLEQGFSAERLVYLGLEYKFIVQYLLGEYSYEEMKMKLAIAIHQFSKRQMTFFRKIEREGHEIKWIAESL